jgi:hypothetical protein
MNKILMTIVAAFIAVACGGNKQSNPYTKILDQAYKAVEKGDFELTEELMYEYEVWLNGLPEDEAKVAEDEFTKWYETNGEKFEAMYEKAMDAYGELYM